MLDTLGSYIIGGIVLVIMTAVILNMQDTARQTMFNEISQISLAEMSQTMEREMTNLGYRVRDPQKILGLSYRSIRFLSDHDNNGVVDTISYTMQRTRQGPTVTRSISRPGSAPLQWTTRGSMVLFTGYDKNGAVTFDPASIRAIEASMLTSNILYDKYAAYDRSSSTSGSVSSTTGLTEVTQDGTLVVNHQDLLRTAVDCQAGAYWHKTIHPRNLTVEAPQLAGDINTGTPVISDPGTTDPRTTDPGTSDPGATDPGTTDPGTTDPGATDPGTTDPGASDPGTGGTVTPPASGNDDPVIVPPKNKNDPCPCGSGLKYKNCHGK